MTRWFLAFSHYSVWGGVAPLFAGGIIIALVVSSTAHAQTTNPCLAPGAAASQVSGVLTDEQGGRVQGATVSVRCPAGVLTVVSGADGDFTLELGAGTHQVRIALDGFEAVTHQVATRPATAQRSTSSCSWLRCPTGSRCAPRRQS